MTAPILISDHALIRYLERVKGFDLEPIRREIEKVCQKASGGSGQRRLSVDGFTYMISNNRVTTVVFGSTPQGAALKQAKHNGNRIKMQEPRR